MIELPLPALPERELTLESDDPTRTSPYRDADEDRPPPLAGRITLGGPIAIEVTPDYVTDDDLKAFVAQEREHSVFHLVHLSVSFAPRPLSPYLASTTVELRLSSTVPVPEPIAWSMTPEQITDRAQVQRTFTLGPQLSLLGVDASLGEIGRTTSREESETFLQALRPLRSDPGWEFRRTKTMDLAGSHRLIMVVRTARGGSAGISGTVKAKTGGNILRWYKRDLPDPLPLATVL